MRMIDIIQKKRNGLTNTEAELAFLIEGFVKNEIPSYQVSAWLMASFLKGLDKEETAILTKLMLHSGTTLDTSSLAGIKVDKHSTGGVGDKTSLLIAPILAAAGAPVPMMSGRGLGHTGGTLDKLESIPGYKVFLDEEEALKIIAKCGYVMMGQTKNMVPADRLLYALRDATGTVESIPLITASILSKKKAEGTDSLFLDVKTGSGAFMKTYEDACALAESLVRVGTLLGIQVEALITDMDEPLGIMVGNFLEIEESYRLLANDSSLGTITIENNAYVGQGPSSRLLVLSLEISARMLVMAKKSKNLSEARILALDLVKSGKALKAFLENIGLQGGDVQKLQSLLSTYRAPLTKTIYAEKSGYVTGLDALLIGKAAVILGAGRGKAEDAVLPDVGIELHVSRSSSTKPGQALATLWARDQACLEEAGIMLNTAIKIEPHVKTNADLIRKEYKAQ